ncbi:MAG: hypothetical protein AAFQ98_24140, partial [Bacteroidota bacterium]
MNKDDKKNARFARAFLVLSNLIFLSPSFSFSQGLNTDSLINIFNDKSPTQKVEFYYELTSEFGIQIPMDFNNAVQVWAAEKMIDSLEGYTYFVLSENLFFIQNLTD